MDIHTKLDVGDEAFLMENNQVRTVDVIEIRITVERGDFGNPEVRVKYVFDAPHGETGSITLPEKHVFATKQDLIESL